MFFFFFFFFLLLLLLLLLLLSLRTIVRRRKAWFRLSMSKILFAAKLRWTTLRMSRPLFVGSSCRSRGGLKANEKEENFASNDNKIY